MEQLVGPSDRKRSGQLVVLIAIIINVVLAELILDYVFPQPVYPIKYSRWGWEHIPNISFGFVPESKESKSFVEYNSDGFRGSDEYAIPTPPDTFRVAILGDSYAEGSAVDYSYLNGKILEDLLGAHLSAGEYNGYKKAEVIKAGVYSYEPCQFLRLFDARVKKYKPKVVFVLHTTKYAADNYCKIGQNGIVYNDLSFSRFEYYSRYLLNYIRAKSQLVNYVWRLYRYKFGKGIHLPEKFNQEMFTYEPVKIDTNRDKEIDKEQSLARYTRGFQGQEGEMPTEESRRLMRAVYRTLDDLVTEYGGQLRIVITHASKKNETLAGDLEQMSIQYFNLASYLGDYQKQDIDFELGGHWNEYGHNLVGKGLFQIVKELELPDLIPSI